MKTDLENVLLLIRKEMTDARRNRWFILYTILFAVLSLALSWFGLSGLGDYGMAGFGRTTASLINLVLLIVPLMGLTLGAMSLAGEREKGTLIYILAQPVSRLEVLAGKYLGLGASFLGALVIGFGLSGVVIALRGGMTEAGSYLALVGFTFLLAMVSLGIGMIISSILPKADSAVGVSLFLWLFLVFMGDLGLLGSVLTLKVDIQQLFYLSLLNPLQVFKLASVFVIRGSLEILGPVGTYAVRSYGNQLLFIFCGILLGWIILNFSLTCMLFNRRGAL